MNGRPCGGKGSETGANTTFARMLRKATRADKPIERVEACGIEQVEDCERGVKPGGTRAKIRKSRRNVELILMGSVEIQAQQRARKPVRKPMRRLGA